MLSAVARGLFSSVAAIVGALAAAQLRASNQVAESINEQWLPTVRWTLDLRAKMTAFRTQEFEHIQAADTDERKPREARLDALSTEIEQVQAAYTTVAASTQQKETRPAARRGTARHWQSSGWPSP
jgi:Four helix bundle sensory module for signal transduction